MMKLLLWAGGLCFAFGMLVNDNKIIGFGAVLLLVYAAIRVLKWSANKTSNVVSSALSERRQEKEFQTGLRREVQRERELAAVRNESTIKLFREQVALIAAHKREGLNVEREIYDMRKKLLEFERDENSAMIGDLISTLDRL